MSVRLLMEEPAIEAMTTGNQTLVACMRHPFRPLHMGFPAKIAALSVGNSIQMEDDPCRFIPFGTIGFGIQQSHIGDPMLPIVVREIVGPWDPIRKLNV